jgi:putative ABC transport system permease protein
MSLFSDLVNAFRAVRRSPGYAFTCIAVLALGIGANAAIFSVIDAVILQPLPYPDPSRLVLVWERYPNMPDPPGSRIQSTHYTYEAWRSQNTVFSDMAAFRDIDLNETGIERPDHLDTGFASANLFPLLGVRAHLGHLFTAAEDVKGSDHVVILTDTFFKTRYRGDPAALGRSLTLDGAAYTIVGVLPPRFHLPAMWEGMDQKKPEVWVPLSRLWNSQEDENRHQLFAAARLKPGATLDQARVEMNGIGQRLAALNPTYNKGWTASVFPFAVEDTSPTLHRALYVLLSAVGILLLIACANLANLTLARATLRSREISIRLALGATRGRIIRQLAAECLLVSFTGAVAGLVLARWCIQGMMALNPPDIQRPELIGINWAVFAFAAGLSVLTTLLFGLAPSIAASSADLNSTLKSAGGWGGSAARLRSRQFLIAAEIALALVLTAGAGLMLRSFYEAVSAGVGFNTGQLLTVEVNLPKQRYPTEESQSRFFHALLDRVRALPGVLQAGAVDNLPLHQIKLTGFTVAGRPETPGAVPLADVAHVDSQFLGVLGLRLVSGRFFTGADVAQGERGGDNVVIVNDAFVRKFLPGENPVGKHLLDISKKHSSEIAGMVADFLPIGAEAGTRPQIFVPTLEEDDVTIMVRTRGAPESYGKALQGAVWSLDRDLPADKVLTMDFYFNDIFSQRRFNTLLIGIFAGLALLLAMMGIYGVLSNLVASRVREIGIRMAIGATPGEIGGLILRQSLIPVVAGLAIGLAGTFALSRYLEALLFHVQPRDPLTLGAAAVVILVISPIALYVPLRRATSVDCTVALREE